MADRPYTLLSCGMSLDGYLDSPDIERLALSNDDDFDRVDEVRAGCDAILIGAATIRNDNPRLLVKSLTRQQDRLDRGLSESPMKVTLTRTGELAADAEFFMTGAAERVVYCPSAVAGSLRARLGSLATVVDAGPRVDLHWLSHDLSGRGVDRLMIEGGGAVNTEFLTEDLVDELQLVLAPLFVGDPRAQRFVGPGDFPWSPGRRARLIETRPIGDVVLLRYALSARFGES